MNSLGLITHKFEDIGVFTYRLQDDCNSPSLSSYCSVIVESKVKVCPRQRFLLYLPSV